ncbi:hypothetical protein DPX16_22705 [Anabarilius grahami]|uniref:Uncharacterized protein n=1 Tax=Anabarilius grahami TaxID=495550 RepID=A0A3N0XZ96_ANAGA|nr:hypothetical protein DPX16_22705 [Anabarilius grahami]
MILSGLGIKGLDRPRPGVPYASATKNSFLEGVEGPEVLGGPWTEQGINFLKAADSQPPKLLYHQISTTVPQQCGRRGWDIKEDDLITLHYGRQIAQGMHYAVSDADTMGTLIPTMPC